MLVGQSRRVQRRLRVVLPKHSNRTAADPRFLELYDHGGAQTGLGDFVFLGHGTLSLKARVAISYKPGRKAGTFRGTVFLSDGVPLRTAVTGSFACKRVLDVA